MDERIAALQKEAARRGDVIGLSGGLPADELMPREELGRALAYVATRRDEALQYGWPEGTRQLRDWIASRLVTRGVTIDPERVIITAGAQQALSLAATALAGHATSATPAIAAARPANAPPVTIAVGAATYPGALDAFHGAGVHMAKAGGDARYVTTGVDMPCGNAVDHREALDAGGPIIVDEAYAELRFDGSLPRPLLADAPDRVWHIGTISKTIAPGLRVGWLVPPAAQHDATLELKSAADLHTASICQAALARLLGTLDYDALVARARAAYLERADRLVTALRREAPDLAFDEPAGGFSIWIETDDRRDETLFLETALTDGVMVDPGSLFCATPRDTLAVRLSFSSAPVDQLAEGARRFVRALTRQVARRAAVVSAGRCS